MSEKEQHNGGRSELSPATEHLKERILDERPMSLVEWQQTLESLYGTINYSKLPEDQELWESFLEKGIDSATESIRNLSSEEDKHEIIN